MVRVNVLNRTVVVDSDYNSPIQDYVHPDHQTQPTFDLHLFAKPRYNFITSKGSLSKKPRPLPFKIKKGFTTNVGGVLLPYPYSLHVIV